MFRASACHGICSNKQLIILEMSAYKILRGQLTLSIELIKPNDLVILTHWFSTTVVLKKLSLYQSAKYSCRKSNKLMRTKCFL